MSLLTPQHSRTTGVLPAGILTSLYSSGLTVAPKTLRTLVTLHLLQSHCTRGLQYPKQSDNEEIDRVKAADRV